MTKPLTEIAVNAFHHTFIWPLLMRGESGKPEEPGIDGHVKALGRANWNETIPPGQVNPSLDPDYTYEEVVYFHPFVRDFLFGDGRTAGINRAIRRFRRKDVRGVHVVIKRDPNSEEEPFQVTLRVERCEILLIRPQVLILLVEVSNRTLDTQDSSDPGIGDPHEALTLDQVFYLQSRLRHIYPPYFDKTSEKAGEIPISVEWIGLKTESYELEFSHSMYKWNRLPGERRNLIVVDDLDHHFRIQIFDSDGKQVVDEKETSLPNKADEIRKLKDQLKGLPSYHKFSDGQKSQLIPAIRSIVFLNLTPDSRKVEFKEFVDIGSEPPMLAHWQAFFGDEIQPLKNAYIRNERGLYLQQLIDDRIPSMSFIAVDSPSEIPQDDLDRLPAFDAPGLDYDSDFRDRLRDGFQYTRFRHNGTTYYGNGTSFAVVCGTDGFTNILLTHFRRHYTHMGLIAQFQHSALLYFADEMADTAKLLSGAKSDKELSNPVWATRIRDLQQSFLKFRTRSYFTEVSNQIQGKDLFRLWFDHLRTAALFDRVSDTNSELYEALENHEMKLLAQAQTRLSEIATWGLGMTIILTAFSTVFAAMPLETRNGWPFFSWIIFGVMVSVIGVGLLIWRSGKKPKDSPP
jgi:hypothetical protein